MYLEHPLMKYFYFNLIQIHIMLLLNGKKNPT